MGHCRAGTLFPTCSLHINSWTRCLYAQNLASLVAHTRTYGIFSLFAARITLHHAHLAHALSQTTKALQCYRVAAALSEQDTFINLSARAGEILIRVAERAKRGKRRGRQRELVKAEDIGEMDWDADVEEVDGEEAKHVAEGCRSMGGTLEAVGQAIEALVSEEIIPAKSVRFILPANTIADSCDRQHLKQALTLASRSQDNYLRAVVLALISAHYFHTSGDHALHMLQTCEQLAAGLGAPVSKDEGGKSGSTKVGNARLGLWVGQMFLGALSSVGCRCRQLGTDGCCAELYKRAGKDHRVQKQILLNQRLEEAVKASEVRGRE
jgi:hypothetical protein